MRCRGAGALGTRCTPASGPQPYAHICASSMPDMQAPCTHCAVYQLPAALQESEAAPPRRPLGPARGARLPTFARRPCCGPLRRTLVPLGQALTQARASMRPRAHASTRLQNQCVQNAKCTSSSGMPFVSGKKLRARAARPQVRRSKGAGPRQRPCEGASTCTKENTTEKRCTRGCTRRGG